MNTDIKKDKLIFEIIEKLQEVNANEWENYVNIKLEFPMNAVTKKKYKISFFLIFNQTTTVL